ncbi:MAG: N-acetyl-gamma-glutamyl-phosphate reductase [Thermoleophilia bacterium]
MGVIKASIVGATGFTGMVLTRLLSTHPLVELDALTSTAHVGRRVDEVFPHTRVSGEYVAYDAQRLGDSEFVFVCYPHAAAHPVVAELVDAGHRVIDLSADFRLADPAEYQRWYGFEHTRPDLVAEAVYGLPEVYRDTISGARLVANPGCFPTASLLASLPLLREGGVGRVIVDAKSGVSGAGKTPTAKTHFSSVHDDFRAYGEVGHRHTSEMVQEVAFAARTAVPVSFTPHLLPVDRGILATVYLCPVGDGEASGAGGLLSGTELFELYSRAYAHEPFVEVRAAAPALSEVQRTNFCRMAVRVDPAAGLYKVVAVIDNLVKGASGQAVQNFNIMAGLPETMGLEGEA